MTLNYERNKSTGKLAREDPAAYELINKALRGELASLEAELDLGAKTPKLMRQIQRYVWLLKGALEHDRNLTLLRQIMQTYERVDAVPHGYH